VGENAFYDVSQLSDGTRRRGHDVPGLWQDSDEYGRRVAVHSTTPQSPGTQPKPQVQFNWGQSATSTVSSAAAPSCSSSPVPSLFSVSLDPSEVCQPRAHLPTATVHHLFLAIGVDRAPGGRALGLWNLPATSPLRREQILLGATTVNLVLVLIAFLLKPGGDTHSGVGWSFGAFVALIAAVVAAFPWPGRSFRRGGKVALLRYFSTVSGERSGVIGIASSVALGRRWRSVSQSWSSVTGWSEDAPARHPTGPRHMGFFKALPSSANWLIWALISLSSMLVSSVPSSTRCWLHRSYGEQQRTTVASGDAESSLSLPSPVCASSPDRAGARTSAMVVAR